MRDSTLIGDSLPNGECAQMTFKTLSGWSGALVVRLLVGGRSGWG
ncbi:hypothetical protein [Lapidilactobacillus salsurivasis]